MPGKVNALNLHNNVFNYGRFVRVLDQIYGISPYIEQQLTPAVGIESALIIGVIPSRPCAEKLIEKSICS